MSIDIVRKATAKTLHGRRVFAAIAAALAAMGTWAWARSSTPASQGSTAILKLDTKHPGVAFQVGTVGLSSDAIELSSGYLSASDLPLVRLMRLLGPSVLRIGGGSVDLSWWTSNDEVQPRWANNTVTPAKLYALRRLLDSTGWRVLLGVDFGHFEPARAADEARIASQIFGRRLIGVEIGNEPNSYRAANSKVERPPGYGVSDYLREAEMYRQAVAAAAPGLAIYGPALSRTRWLVQMGAAANLFTVITQHYYPSDSCASAPPGPVPLPTVDELLSPLERQIEDETLNTLVQVGAIAGRPTLIGETGTGPCRGSSFASAAFASSLWSLDWVLRAADRGVAGVDFHGHFGLCGPDNQSPICASTPEAARATRVTPQPEYYGMLAAAQLEGGRFIPTRLVSPVPAPNLTTWATLAPGGKITIAIDNLAVAGLPQPVSIPASAKYSATEQLLTASSVEATGGVALGGAHLTSSGRWRPKATKLGRRGGKFRIVVNPASAVVVTLRRARSRR